MRSPPEVMQISRCPGKTPPQVTSNAFSEVFNSSSSTTFSSPSYPTQNTDRSPQLYWRPCQFPEPERQLQYPKPQGHTRANNLKPQEPLRKHWGSKPQKPSRLPKHQQRHPSGPDDSLITSTTGHSGQKNRKETETKGKDQSNKD